MDAPNAPNPTNPNAQINLWMQYKVLAAQAQGPAAQDHPPGPAAQVQGLTAQYPANNNARVGQNVPIQPPHQLAPASPVPTGLVVPAPQVFYQNWIGKKPEFSGKTEEDAKSHLLSTRDWMEAYNFPNRSKLDNFV